MIFVLGLLVATFLGGAFRAYMSSAQIRYWIEREVADKQPKFEFKFQDVDFALSKGAFPRFGLHFKDIWLAAKDKCITPSEISIADFYVPIRLSSLLLGKVKFSDIEIKDLQINYYEPICNRADKVIVSEDSLKMPERPDPARLQAPQKVIQSTGYRAIKQFFSNRFEHELKNSRQWFDSLLFENVVFYNAEKKKKQLQMKRLFFDFTGGEKHLDIEAQLEVHGIVSTQSVVPPFEVTLQLTKEKVLARIDGQFNEGKVQMESSLHFESGVYAVDSNLKYIPLAFLVDMFKTLNLSSITIQPKLFWLSCVVGVNGVVDRADESVFDVRSCGLSGDVGRIDLLPAKVAPFKTKDFIPIDLQIKKLSLRKLLGFFGKKGFPGLLTSFGEINGELKITQPDSLLFIGGVNGLEILFSNRGKRRLQKVNNISGEIELKEGRLSGVIDQVDLVNGSYEGTLSFNFDQSLDEGLIQVKVDQLKFNDQVDQLLSFGIMTPLQIYGQGSFREGELKDWAGQMGVLGIKGAHWEVAKIKIKSEYADELFKAKLKIDRVVVGKESDFYEQLHSMLLYNERFKDEIVFNNLKADYELSFIGGVWKRFQAHTKYKDISLASGGKWNYRGYINGWINVDLPDLKLLNWEVKGEAQNPKLVPSQKLLDVLAMKVPNLKAPSTTNESLRWSFFNKILKRDRISKIKNLGQEVLQRAKKLLPIGDTTNTPEN